MIAILFASLLASSLPAAERIEKSSSLKFVPFDAAFFGSSLRNGEKFKAVADSNAFKTLMELPVVKEAVKEFWTESRDGNIVQFRNMLKGENGKETMAALSDMFSDEVFIYGGEGYSDLLDLVNQLHHVQHEATLKKEDSEVMVKKLIDLMLKNSDQLDVPDTVIGFKLKDKKRIEEQLTNLRLMASLMLGQYPELKMRFQKKQKIAGGEFSVLTLDGSMIPWDEIPLDNLGNNKKDAEKLIKMLKGKSLVISIGIRDDYLLLSISHSNDHLRNFEQGKLLADR